MSPRSSGASPRARGHTQPPARTTPVGDDSIRLLRPEPAEASSVPNSERVYRGLRDQILSGGLVANARLVEVQLASQFAVSRTPVREALKRLAAEGLVSADPLRGMVVRDVDSAEIEDIYVIREVLEGLAARLASEQGVTICQSSRVGSGRVVRAPSLVKRGWVAADNLVPWKARLLLALAPSQTSDPAEIQRLFDTC